MGRPEGTYRRSNDSLCLEMLFLLRTGKVKTPYAAAKQVASKLPGERVERRSTIRRLTRHLERHGPRLMREAKAREVNQLKARFLELTQPGSLGVVAPAELREIDLAAELRAAGLREIDRLQEIDRLKEQFSGSYLADQLRRMAELGSKPPFGSDLAEEIRRMAELMSLRNRG